MKNSIDYLDKIVNVLEVPYFKELGYYGINDKEEREYIFKQIYGFEISIGNSESTIYDLISGNIIYYERSDGYWNKKEFDTNGNIIYYEYSTGEWYKREYDLKGRRIYDEDSNGKKWDIME